MASISVNIPDKHIDRVVEALAMSGHWTEDLGVTKPVYAKQVVQQMIKERTLTYERRVLQENAVLEPPELDGL